MYTHTASYGHNVGGTSVHVADGGENSVQDFTHKVLFLVSACCEHKRFVCNFEKVVNFLVQVMLKTWMLNYRHVQGWHLQAKKDWHENLEEFSESGQQELSLVDQFSHHNLYKRSHFFSMLEYLSKWQVMSNVRQPCTRKHVCIGKVILWINFISLLQICEQK
jgi:hypothetical protein